MNNMQIITAIAENIWGADAVQDMQAKGIIPPVHTYKKWLELGYQVRKNEKAKIETKLWRRRGRHKEAPYEEESETTPNREYYLCKAYLFTEDQVVKIE